MSTFSIKHYLPGIDIVDGNPQFILSMPNGKDYFSTGGIFVEALSTVEASFPKLLNADGIDLDKLEDASYMLEGCQVAIPFLNLDMPNLKIADCMCLHAHGINGIMLHAPELTHACQMLADCAGLDIVVINAPKLACAPNMLQHSHGVSAFSLTSPFSKDDPEIAYKNPCLAASTPSLSTDDAVLIAKKYVTDLMTLEAQNSDGLDFHTIAVWSIEDMLNDAYKKGLAAAIKPVVEVDMESDSDSGMGMGS